MSKRHRQYNAEEAEREIVGDLRKKCCPSVADVLAMLHAVPPPPPENVAIILQVRKDGTPTKRARKAIAEMVRSMDRLRRAP